MACYHPLKAWQIGYHESGKPKYKITGYNIDHLTVDENGEIINALECIEIPCGKCIGCRLAYSRMWADRCLAEATLHESSYFVTFTYNDTYLPINTYVDENGEIRYSMTLNKKDFQNTMKRIRKNYNYDNKLRFFMAGEYGNISARPHYHALIFGLKLDDLQLYKKTAQGFNLYTSEFLEKCWQHKGYVIVAEVTWETCAYTARYILKKQKGEAAKIYEQLNIKAEFTLMSRKPGIAREFYEINKDQLNKYNEVYVSTNNGGKKIGRVKYFDKLLEVEYPIDTKKYKDQLKKNLEIRKEKKKQGTSVSYLEMLEIEERNKQERIKNLIRKEI